MTINAAAQTGGRHLSEILDGSLAGEGDSLRFD